MAYDEGLAERVRELLSDVHALREQKMMGGLCFMVDGHMCCGIMGDALMARVGPDAYEDCLGRDHVRPIEMGAGRQLRGFVRVDPAGLEDDAGLAEWVQRGRLFVVNLPER